MMPAAFRAFIWLTIPWALGLGSNPSSSPTIRTPSQRLHTNCRRAVCRGYMILHNLGLGLQSLDSSGKTKAPSDLTRSISPLTNQPLPHHHPKSIRKQWAG
jgi:hypothetical protein